MVSPNIHFQLVVWGSGLIYNWDASQHADVSSANERFFTRAPLVLFEQLYLFHSLRCFKCTCKMAIEVHAIIILKSPFEPHDQKIWDLSELIQLSFQTMWYWLLSGDITQIHNRFASSFADNGSHVMIPVSIATLRFFSGWKKSSPDRADNHLAMKLSMLWRVPGRFSCQQRTPQNRQKCS